MVSEVCMLPNGNNRVKILRPLFLSETASNDYLEHSDCISNTFGAFLARFTNFDKNSLNNIQNTDCFCSQASNS